MRKKIVSLSLTGVIILESITACVFMSAIPVFALSAGGLQSTIASIILSLMLQCGTAPTNQAWLTALNNSYGVESSIGTIADCVSSGLLTETSTGLVDTGLSTAIANQSAYTELGLAEIFTTSADDVSAGVIAGSGATNLANTAINVGTLGTIGAFAGATAVGVGLGVLIDKVRNYIGDYIKYGAPLDMSKELLDVPDGYNMGFVQANTPYYGYRLYKRVIDKDTGFIRVIDGSNEKYYNVYYGDGQNVTLNFIDNQYNSSNQKVYDYTATYTGVEKGSDRSWLNFISGYTTINTNINTVINASDLQNYLNGVKNGTITKPSVISPDIIGKDGNQQASTDQEGNIVFPDIQSTVPDGYDMKPVDMDDYENFAGNANNNTNNGETGQPVQGEAFDDLIDGLLVEPSIIPDQGITVPDVPDHPVIPDQPNVPGKDPITGEEQSEVLQGITTPDLRAVFPFCIPFDIYNALLIVKPDGREAPVIIWEMPIGDNWTIVLDLSEFDEVAALLRKLELILFIIGLAVATRYLIGAT